MTKYNQKNSLLMFFITSFYLLIEIWFNITLIDKSSQILTLVEINSLETIGRLISTIGLSIIIFKIISYNNKNKDKSLLFNFAIIIPIGIMFFVAQKIIVEEFIDNSSAELRQKANKIMLIKQDSIINNKQFKPISSPVNENDNKVLLSLSPFLLITVEDNEVRKSIFDYVFSAAKNKADQHYDEYLKYQEVIQNTYQKYKEISKKHSVTDHEYSIIVNNYNELYANKKRLLSSKKMKESSFNETIKHRVQYIKSVIPYIINQIKTNDYENSLYIEKWHRRLQKDTTIKNGLHPFYFCKVRKTKKYPSITEALYLKNNITLLNKYDCSKKVLTNKNLKNRLNPLLAEKYISKYGYNPTLSDDYFLSSNFIKNKIENESLKRGIKLDLPIGWHINDRESFIKSAEKSILKQKKNEINKQLLKNGIHNIPLGLSFNDFYNHEKIQERIKKETGHDLFINLNLNKKEFNNRTLTKAIKHKAEKVSQSVLGNSDTFKDGGIDAQDGKASLKAIIIPPLAITLSLLFGLINFANLIGLISKIKIIKNTIKISSIFMLLYIAILSKASFAKTLEEIDYSSLTEYKTAIIKIIAVESYIYEKISPYVSSWALSSTTSSMSSSTSISESLS